MKPDFFPRPITKMIPGLLLLSPALAQTPTMEEAQSALRAGAERSRSEYSDLSYAKFKEKTFKEPFENGKFIVNGDTSIIDEKHLREFYDKNVAAAPPVADDKVVEFAVMTVGGLQAIWSNAQKRALTYCVSNAFGSRYSQVVAQMENAAAAWEAVADLDFVHLMSEDGDCRADNSRVVFDVRPVDVFGRYLARAFFPNEPRVNRNVLIDNSSFQLDPNQTLQLSGVLRHELGHTIGARHEHTRPEAGACFEDDNWQPLTDYDAFSVMHYPQCNGMGDWSLTLTDRDKNGAACLYGAAPGFAANPSLCSSTIASTVTLLSFDNESVAKNEEKRYPAGASPTLRVKPGSLFVASLSGAGSSPGDPDLYVKFDGTPQVGLEYDCRPYLTGAEERCELNVPSSASIARVMVHGYQKGSYDLSISYVEP